MYINRKSRNPQKPTTIAGYSNKRLHYNFHSCQPVLLLLQNPGIISLEAGEGRKGGHGLTGASIAKGHEND